jgi:hypothetical protein
MAAAVEIDRGCTLPRKNPPPPLPAPSPNTGRPRTAPPVADRTPVSRPTYVFRGKNGSSLVLVPAAVP